MREQKFAILELKGHKHRIRRYKQGHMLATPLDRFIYHLAYHVCDDITNPPDWFWAAIIYRPYEAGARFLRDFYPPLTWEEKHALLDAEAAIVFVRQRRVLVKYFDDLEKARREWDLIKASAKGTRPE